MGGQLVFFFFFRARAAFARTSLPPTPLYHPAPSLHPLRLCAQTEGVPIATPSLLLPRTVRLLGHWSRVSCIAPFIRSC